MKKRKEKKHLRPSIKLTQKNKAGDEYGDAYENNSYKKRCKSG